MVAGPHEGGLLCAWMARHGGPDGDAGMHSPLRGMSIAVKMILTTTLLIVVTGVGAGLLNIINVRRSFDDAAEQRVELFQQARTQIGRLGTPLFARATEALVLERGRDKDILTLVQNAVRDDTHVARGKTDYVLRLAYVLDLNRQVIAHCHEAAQLECKLFETHEAVTPALGAVTVESWRSVQAAWNANAADGGSALVELSLASDGAPYRIFAYPIFVGEQPTAATARHISSAHTASTACSFSLPMRPLAVRRARYASKPAPRWCASRPRSVDVRASSLPRAGRPSRRTTGALEMGVPRRRH